MNTLDTLKDSDDNLITVSNAYWVDLYQHLQNLYEHPSFQRLICEAYLKESVLSKTYQLTSQNTVKNGLRPHIFEELTAVSHLLDYFNTIEALGGPVDESELEELED